MLYITKINDYIEILTDEEVKESVSIFFSESIKEEQNLRKVDYNWFELQLNLNYNYNWITID